MFNNKTKQSCAISMEAFGISTVVMTTLERIQLVLDQYSIQPDKAWCGGRGKKYLHKSLKAKLVLQDVHFNKHPELVSKYSEEWSNFCEDCILLYVLDAYLFEKPFELIHPESYAQNLSKASIDATGGVIPDLIPGISVIH